MGMFPEPSDPLKGDLEGLGDEAGLEFIIGHFAFLCLPILKNTKLSENCFFKLRVLFDAMLIP